MWRATSVRRYQLWAPVHPQARALPMPSTGVTRSNLRFRNRRALVIAQENTRGIPKCRRAQMSRGGGMPRRLAPGSHTRVGEPHDEQQQQGGEYPPTGAIFKHDGRCCFVLFFHPPQPPLASIKVAAIWGVSSGVARVSLFAPTPPRAWGKRRRGWNCGDRLPGAVAVRQPHLRLRDVTHAHIRRGEHTRAPRHHCLTDLRRKLKMTRWTLIKASR